MLNKLTFSFCFLLSISVFAQTIEISTLEVQYILNTFILLFSSALVMWMAAGFCMLESGLVKSKSTGVICLKNILLYGFACMAYYIVGYNLMFVGVESWVGSFSFFVFPTAQELSFLNGFTQNGSAPATFSDVLASGSFSLAGVFFQMVFVATTASIISGSLAERIKLWSFFVFIIILAAFIYPIVGAWTWGGGWLSQMGFQDFAGSSVVHSTGAWAALAGAFLIGPRLGKYTKDGKIKPTPASNIPLVTLGTFILWFGWLGFNGGSVLHLNNAFDASTMALVFFNTNIAAVAGVIAALVLSIILYKRVAVLVVLNAAIGGLVSITAGPNVTNPLIAIFIGAVGGVLVTVAVPLLEKWKIDDVVGAIPAHLFPGIWGTLAVGIFGTASFTVQLIGVLSIGVFVIVTSTAVWLMIKYLIGLRVSEQVEILGQDITELGIEAYPEFLNISDIQKN